MLALYGGTIVTVKSEAVDCFATFVGCCLVAGELVACRHPPTQHNWADIDCRGLASGWPFLRPYHGLLGMPTGT